ncbi:MAG: hypothetical protein OHK0039_13950 [Bacteroidia bacterium]
MQVAGQPLTASQQRDFTLEVKQVDEFFERFNFDRNTLVLQYMAKNYPGRTFSRSEMLLTLFNAAKPNWDTALVGAFIRDVTRPRSAALLDFYAEDWYAELDCSVFYRGMVKKATLVMEIQCEADNSSRWIIRGVQADFLDLPRQEDDHKAINPMSHGTDFMALGKALDDTRNLRNVVYRGYEAEAMSLFMHELQTGNIEFQQVNNICYHFLQVPGWIFQVRRYLRNNSTNSGWLIDELVRADEMAKAVYRYEVLHLR